MIPKNINVNLIDTKKTNRAIQFSTMLNARQNQMYNILYSLTSRYKITLDGVKMLLKSFKPNQSNYVFFRIVTLTHSEAIYYP